MKRTALVAALTVALTGCSLAPSYQQPEAPVAEQWDNTDQYSAVTPPHWRDFFADPILQDLIETALKNNRDLRIAALNVDAFRAQYRIERSAQFPSINASGGANRQRLPGSMTADGNSAITSQYSANLGITAWELDLFNRLGNLSEQALETYFASEQAQRSTQLSLIASVATAWLNLQADQETLALVRDTLATYEDSLRLVEHSYDVGIATLLELQQARTAANSARISLAQFERQTVQSRNALNLLLGGTPRTNLLTPVPLSHFEFAELPVGLPAHLLQRRPDILQAEHQLKAAHANIGAARAAFFPSISLTTHAGSLSPDLSGLFDAGSGSWLFMPSINLPIFNAGRLRANLNYSEIQKDINVAHYEKAIQTAFQEVADGLIERTTYKQQLAAHDEMVQTSEEYYALADLRYREGVDNQLTLLDAQRLLFDAKQKRINTHFAKLASEINLYKALGGGYSQEL
ncbi:efflux transporter outer membrane subunit [Denitrificimonas sp. JX-1]|uniref:Efflux transporter outer membrane subunit n=1 Tax=Denitrificimonas halotolerans TaxID=3098930 RepID=A0ABU5GRR6_9GAMM|nr:efflux transporter outer membrane subunit [Denitrificimonas sp. JX-1]MDY7219554.1 efflux transporter outer membrane subunit [Denitrificimonas sp. JX-1]